jgi:hypothetical protein
MDFVSAGNANSKTIKFYVNGNMVVSSGTQPDNAHGCYFRATIKRLSSTSTLVTVDFVAYTGSSWTSSVTAQFYTITWSGSVIVKATGQSGTGSNDITQYSSIMKYLPANP